MVGATRRVARYRAARQAAPTFRNDEGKAQRRRWTFYEAIKISGSARNAGTVSGCLRTSGRNKSRGWGEQNPAGKKEEKRFFASDYGPPNKGGERRS